MTSGTIRLKKEVSSVYFMEITVFSVPGIIRDRHVYREI